ncbi:fructose-6-phosphate aldolase [Pelagibacteraceae bacterium]|nr:fructose-6-phosphate aldolase [Pelagibacteraceae bacterium]
MEFFLDTAEVKVIKKLSETGLVDGITTNPSLIAKSGKDFLKTLKEISKIIKGPISAEVTALDLKGMVQEAKKLSQISKNIVIKLPLTEEGLKTCKFLSKKKIKTNVTLCFSAAQALLAAKCGATYISPFVGRLDDIGENGMSLIQDIKSIYMNYSNLKTKILVASVRTTEHVIQSAIIGADVVTLPPATLKELSKHPLTDKGLDAFLKDWKKTKQKIV